MSLIEILKAILFGVVEGVTEWLPISSTGHLILLDQFVKLDVTPEFWHMFLVVIQLGAIIAVCVLFFYQLNPFSPSKDQAQKKQTWSMWAKTIVACIPAAVVGIPLDDLMDEYLSSPYIIAAMLILYGILFIIVENKREKRVAQMLEHKPQHLKGEQNQKTIAELADKNARVKTMDELDWKTAMGIGLFQVLSIVPGTSRSGSTIIGGLILGCSRAVAAEFTFYLAIPVMVGASGLRLVKFFLKGGVLAGSEGTILAVGCIVAFIVSIIVIRFLMSYIKKHDFKPFGWYRIVLGIVIIGYFASLAHGLI